MKIQKSTKTINAEPWERHAVMNYLTHCVDKVELKDWRINYVTSKIKNKAISDTLRTPVVQSTTKGK